MRTSPLRSAALLVAMLIAAATVALLALPSFARPAAAATTFSFPGLEGTSWSVLAGYNTATHSMADRGDPYALDIQRVDGETGGSLVLAPVSGTVSYVSSSCVTIRDASRTSVLMCHILASQALRGRAVTRGQQIGVVAPAGEAGNNGVAHIHLALTAAAGGALPFTGAYALEGTELAATTEAGAYTGTVFASTNRPRPGVDAGADLTVRPGSAVTLNASVTNATGATLAYVWTQTAGSTVPLSANGPSATFVAPARTGTLAFRVALSDGSPEVVSDTVTVRVSTAVPVSTAPAAPGRFSAVPVFSTGGQALAIFSSGTVAQLESAALGVAASGVWVQDGGGEYRLLIVNGPAFLRDAFAARFTAGFASVTAVTLVR